VAELLGKQGTKLVAIDNVHAILTASGRARRDALDGSVAKIVKLEHAWRRLNGWSDDGFQVAPFPG
jgi:hypothetical protein